MLARRQTRLLADYTDAVYLLHLVIGVGNDPMTADQLRRHQPGIDQTDFITERILVMHKIGLIRDKDSHTADLNAVTFVIHSNPFYINSRAVCEKQHQAPCQTQHIIAYR